MQDIIVSADSVELPEPQESEELLPESNLVSTAETNVSRSRFSGADWLPIAENTEVGIIGAGGIGSWVAFFLSKMCRKITLIDPDTFESANMSGQFVSRSEIGLPKSHAVRNLCLSFGNFDISCIKARYGHPNNDDEDDLLTTYPVTIVGPDNMQARQVAFDIWNTVQVSCTLEHARSKLLFIDGRLTADSYQLYVLRGDDAEAIEKYANEALFSDEEADDTICSFKQTAHIAAMLASRIVTVFTIHCLYKENKGVWTVPYLEEFEAPLFCTITNRL